MDNLRGKVYLIRVMAKSDMMAHGVKGNIQDKEYDENEKVEYDGEFVEGEYREDSENK